MPQYPYIFTAVLLAAASPGFAQQVADPANNIPVTPATVSPAGANPLLYNTTHGLPQNYIQTLIPDQPVTVAEVNIKHRQITEYFDGLGRPLQTVAKRGHADGNDIVQPFVYDAAGRQSINYLPYARPAHQSIGEFDHLPKARLEDFYPAAQGQEPFSKTTFDNSPLNRPVVQMAPGKSWVGSGRGVNLSYMGNFSSASSGGSTPVLYNSVGGYPRFNIVNGQPVYAGNYEDGTLLINTTKDEDGNLKEEIIDKKGRILVQRTRIAFQNGPFIATAPFPDNYNYTFYVYDDLDRLSAVLPPGSVSVNKTLNISGNTNTYTYNWSIDAAQMAEIYYGYTYDKLERLIEKKIPGKAIEYYVYDSRDRMVFSQDGNLRQQGKWAFNFYDGLDRATVSGLISLSDSRAALQTQAVVPPPVINISSWQHFVHNYNTINTASGLYPATLNNGEILTYSYYDNYNNATAGFSASKMPAAPAGDATIVPSTLNNATRGLLTGTKVKVLEPGQPSGNEWINTTYYYDFKGRIIQTVANNMMGGTDYNSQLYYFQGMPYQSVTHHHNPAAQAIPGAGTALNNIKLDKIYRRNLGYGGNDQVWQLRQSINDGTPYNLAYYDYDHLGRVVVKQYTMANVLQEYNIRGWLKQIHARNPMYPDSTYFKEDLYYDDGFASKLYNGNIAGITWNNYGVIPANNSRRNAYGYSYDNLGRLTHAEYRNNPLISAGWVKHNKDYTVSNLSYDERGNILSMNQRGNNTNGPINMDQLSYQYATSNNQLIKVSDGSTANTSNLPDFKDNADLTEEYTYDNNGNLLTDANKSITSITYNHLNKPIVITVQGKGSISYLYDAIGNRLRKTIYTEADQSTEVWDYNGSMVYKNNVLQYILNEEGRSRPEVVTGGTQHGATKFVYDYFIKDHLGNVRTTLAAEPASHEYYARHEMATANSEQLIFDNIAAVRDDKPGSISMDDRKAARLNAAETDRSIGTAIMLRVMPGDKFTFAADAYYEEDQEPKDYEHTGAEEIVSSLLATLTGGTVGGKPVSETQNGKIINDIFSKPETMTGIQQLLDNVSSSGNAPRAGLNYLFFDEQMNLLSGSGRLVLDHLPTAFTNLAATVETEAPGYVIVYVDNQTIGKDVWFDDVQVLHYNTRVLEENHYYPFGLTVATEAIGVTKQPLKYQSKELEQSFGLEMYDFTARMYDPQLGRTWQPDPMAELRSWVSPFSWVQNNPIGRIDPTGAIDEPVYTSSGIYRDDTEEGFTGQVIIYDGDKDFTKMTKDELLNNTKDDEQKAKTYDEVKEDLGDMSKSNIWSHILSRFEGQYINGVKFSMKSLNGERVHFNAKKSGSWSTFRINDEISGSGRYFYETTVENIASSLFVHEWYSHMILGIKDRVPGGKTPGNHRLAYENVMKHELWEKTTSSYKYYMLRNLQKYYCDELDQELSSENQKLLDKYYEENRLRLQK